MVLAYRTDGNDLAGGASAAVCKSELDDLLTAVGATQKHLRLALLTNGVVVGAIGALTGTIVGLALWFAVVPALEPAVNHRIDRLGLPLTLLAIVLLIAVVGATAAAWWPGRMVARVPVTLALSARPPRPKPAHHSAILALVLIGTGIGSLVFAAWPIIMRLLAPPKFNRFQPLDIAFSPQLAPSLALSSATLPAR